MTKHTQSRISMGAGTAVSADIYYMSCSLDDPAIDEPCSRLFFYQDQTKEKWFYHDQPGWRVVSTCLLPEHGTTPRSVVALSEEGGIEVYNRNGSHVEKIVDAGLSDSSKGYGYLNRVRLIGGALFACGYGGQLYKRGRTGWRHVDQGLLRKPSLPMPADRSKIEEWMKNEAEVIDVLDVNGVSQTDIYAVGDHGFIAHYDGSTWVSLRPKTQSCLYSLYIESANDVWIAGSQGTLLKGNAQSGFQAVLRKSTEADFYAMTKFNDEVYIGASDGLYKLLRGDVIATEPTLKMKMTEVADVEAKEGVLWALASKHLLRFDGKKWDIFEHIDNT
ncbi:hypothetical protein DBR37_08945 [Herminiimonas sp. KBW02]|uniref:hypothetical protein n=1 Tax=Herminiimonas sp. KBW02 TaxID=2153363 RepID=UPI000F5A810B|nr:hypothetical protein [Herminiimonas sp. KBW02]RQO36426.1 hypothetical protein DBR37_08945 [Herminiimonas sp. KBW02]